ncbi:MAG: nucleotidyltransferase family protein [Candidatus Aenigmarchaeota archaeon]|nr:nucleotidyltransferase family protein [Candidatus Aenigmarchaeota archaeon]
MKLKTAVVLVGGKALRLRPLTEDVPKCMIELSGRPLLSWILAWLKNNGIERVVLGVAYKKEVIEQYVQQNDFGMRIELNDHSGADGTGEAFRLAVERKDVRDEVFLAMNGDELTDVSLRNFLTFHLRHQGVATLLACPLKSPFGVLTTDNSHGITSFQEKPILDTYFINAGVYLFTQAIRPYLPQAGDIERTAFAQLAREGKLKAFKYFGFWSTVNNIKDIVEMEANVDILRETREE